MFVNVRGDKGGILKLKDLPILKDPECRSIHDSILSLRNEHIAHNDSHSGTAHISWSAKHQIHFPQRFRKVYWSIEEAEKVWALMKTIEKLLLDEIYASIKFLGFPPKRSFTLENGLVEKLKTLLE